MEEKGEGGKEKRRGEKMKTEGCASVIIYKGIATVLRGNVPLYNVYFKYSLHGPELQSKERASLLMPLQAIPLQ